MTTSSYASTSHTKVQGTWRALVLCVSCTRRVTGSADNGKIGTSDSRI